MRNVFSANGKATPGKSDANFVMWNALSVAEAGVRGVLTARAGPRKEGSKTGRPGEFWTPATMFDERFERIRAR